MVMKMFNYFDLIILNFIYKLEFIFFMLGVYIIC